jgi:hypothetical protein
VKARFAPLLAVMALAAACIPHGAPAATHDGASPSQGVTQPTPTPPPSADPRLQTAQLPTGDQIVADVSTSLAIEDWPGLESSTWDGRCIPDTSQVCSGGDPNGGQVILVYGDSYAGMWWPALAILAYEAGLRAELHSLGHCPVPVIAAWDYAARRRNTECDAFRPQVVADVARIRPAIVVLASAFQGTAIEVDGQPTRDGMEGCVS